MPPSLARGRMTLTVHRAMLQSEVRASKPNEMVWNGRPMLTNAGHCCLDEGEAVQEDARVQAHRRQALSEAGRGDIFHT